MSQLRIGAILSYLNILITLIIGLVYTPVMIRLLGQSEYGLYALIGSIAAYFSILDLGLGNSIVRYIARNRIDKIEDFESKLIGTFLLLFSLVSILTIIIGSIVYFNIDTIFSNKMSITEIYKGKIMILILTVNFALSFPLSVFSSVLIAYEKFSVEKTMSILRILLAPIISLPFLFWGYGSVMLVLVTTLVNIATLIYVTIYAIKHLKIRIKFTVVDKQVLYEIFGYSFFIFLNIFIDQIFWKTDQIILGILTGTVTVAIYAIAMHFINIYMKFSTAISNLFLPRISMMIANNSSEKEISDVMIRYGRVQYLLIGLLLSGFIIFGEYFIIKWAGIDYQNAYYFILIIMIPLTVPLIQNIGITILQAKNQLKFRATLYLIIAIINIIITIPLAKYYGGFGTAIVTAFSLFIAHILIMNIYYQKRVGIDIIRFWKNIITLTIPNVLLTVVAYFIIQLIQTDSLIEWLLSVFVFTLLYLGVLWITAMNKYEKQLVFSIVDRFR